IFDSDTHVGPYMEVLERYLSSEEKAKLLAWEPFKSKNAERVVYTKGQRRYLRKLGTAAAEADKGAYMAGFTGAKKSREPAPHGVPLDHPTLEPVWAAAQAHDLAVVLHTFTVMPPYAPGGLDTWENLWLQRSAAHPWCGMRNMASLIGAGVMDRYPRLRVATLEAGHGWLPFWMSRIDEHAETIAAAIPKLKGKPSEYVMGG